MNVQMRYFLMPVLADIGEQAIARLDEPRSARDRPDRADEPGDFRIARACREVRKGRGRIPHGATA